MKAAGDRFYHGGFPGLAVGQRILPASQTGAPSTASFGAAGVCDPSRVYLTTDVHAAILFACMHPSLDGQVYRVAPIGVLQADPDCNIAGLSFSCDAALIVGRVKVKRKQMARCRAAVLAGW
jgi:hypothetical protein